MFKVKWTIFGDENFWSTIQLELETRGLNYHNWRRKLFRPQRVVIIICDKYHFVHKELNDQNWGQIPFRPQRVVIRIGDKYHFIHKMLNDQNWRQLPFHPQRVDYC